METFAERMQMMSVQFLPFMIAVIFHEYAHGFVANRFGDSTAKNSGRLTLNPISHIDPIGTLLLPLMSMLGGFHVLFGWAKPVPINPNRFSRYRSGLVWVSAAGSLMNFLLALLSAFLLIGTLKWVAPSAFVFEPLKRMAIVSVQLNFMLGLFNLVPVPPLDGSKIVQAFLPFEKALRFEQMGLYVSWIMLFLAVTGLLAIVFSPILWLTEILTSATVTLAALALGLT